MDYLRDAVGGRVTDADIAEIAASAAGPALGKMGVEIQSAMNAADGAGYEDALERLKGWRRIVLKAQILTRADEPRSLPMAAPCVFGDPRFKLAAQLAAGFCACDEAYKHATAEQIANYATEQAEALIGAAKAKGWGAP